ncbi:MAG: hypothetical protein RI932_1759 [Pseudomonadota bacterium]|jgi:hypothetical protein
MALRSFETRYNMSYCNSNRQQKVFNNSGNINGNGSFSTPESILLVGAVDSQNTTFKFNLKLCKG